MIGTLLLLFAARPGRAADAPARTVEYVETVRVPPKAGKVRLWLPVPTSDDYQSVETLETRAEAAHRLTKDKDFGSPILYFEADGKKPLSVSVKYRITRRRAAASPASLSEEQRRFFTSPRALAIVDEKVRKIAGEQAAGKKEARAVARSLYDYVLGHMAYDKTEPGWGRGDTARACVVGKGNCTDFHSLFMSLAAADGIPVRFNMGLQLKPDAAQSLEKSYHCWAEFFQDGLGWVPVDISEAWKHKELAEFYFGGLDQNRIHLSTGRAVTLEPAQDGPALNYFAYPYLESAGAPDKDFEFERTVRDVAKEKKS